MTTQQETKNNNPEEKSCTIDVGDGLVVVEKLVEPRYWRVPTIQPMTPEERRLLMMFFKIMTSEDEEECHGRSDVIEVADETYSGVEEAKRFDEQNVRLLRFCLKTFGACKCCGVFPSFENVGFCFRVRKYDFSGSENTDLNSDEDVDYYEQELGAECDTSRRINFEERYDVSDEVLEDEINEREIFYELHLEGNHESFGGCAFCLRGAVEPIELKYQRDIAAARRRGEEFRKKQKEIVPTVLEGVLIPELVRMISDYL